MGRVESQDKVDLLQSIRLFRHVPKKQMKELVKRFDVVEKPKGSVLMRQGETGRELLVIAEGSAKVTRDGAAINTLGKGDVIGEMALLDGHPRSATVTADEDCTLLVLEGRQFVPLLTKIDGLAEHLLQSLSERIRETDAKIV